MDDISRSDGPDPEDSMGSCPSGIGDRMPVTAIVCGRGRVGKTMIANTIVQVCRRRGARLEVWNSDQQNQTHSLSLFHADALRPATDDPEEKRLWFERNLARQIRERFDVVFDMAGGDPMIRQLARDVRLVKAMERRGTRAVAWHVLGPEPADLDYLKLSMEGGLFMPAATLLVVNTGLVTSGRSVEAAFAEVCGHEVVVDALEKGAKLVWFPRLICMGAVVDQGLSFEEASRGVTKPGREPLSFTDETRVEIFWEDEVPKFFAAIPPHWLPAMPGGRS